MIDSLGGKMGLDPAMIDQMRSRILEQSKTKFQDSDANADGVLDVGELEKLQKSGPFGGKGPNASEMLEAADTNLDGGLSLEELQAQFKKLAPQMLNTMIGMQESGFGLTATNSNLSSGSASQGLYNELFEALNNDDDEAEKAETGDAV